MRKSYIDYIRIICILLLFPFHTCMVFNSFGEPFYVTSQPVTFLTQFVIIVYPWWMMLLFTLAGVSSAYALKKRSYGEYVRERKNKLLIPLLTGLIFIIPVQTYIADVFHNGYSGNYFEHYAVFFTKFTDLSGYDGGFTPAHTWFMLYLYLVSMISIPIMRWYDKREKKIDGSRITMGMLLPMFIIILALTPVLEIGGKSIGEAFACFMLGYFVISHDEVQEKLMKYRFPLAAAWIVLMAVRDVMFLMDHDYGLFWDVEQRVLTWAGILAIIGLGRKYLNYNNGFTKYFSPAAFPLYFFHQSVLIIIGFFVLKLTDRIPLQFLLILTLSFLFTLLCYELFRSFKLTCYMFGIKPERSNHGRDK